MSSAAALTWFARHEFRLAWREWLAMMTGGRRKRKRAVIGLIVFAVILHLPAYAVIGRFTGLQMPLDKSSLIVMSASIFLAWALMLSQAIELVTRVFYARADLDLIMSSPVRLANIFSVRIVAIALSVTGMALLLSTPFVDVLVIGGGARWLGGVRRRHRDRAVGLGGCDRDHAGAVSPDRPEPDPAGIAGAGRRDRRRLCHRAADRRDPVLWHAVALRRPDFGRRSRIRARTRQHGLVAGARDARRRRNPPDAAGVRPDAARRGDGAVLQLSLPTPPRAPRPMRRAPVRHRAKRHSAPARASRRCAGRSLRCCGAIRGWCRRR